MGEYFPSAWSWRVDYRNLGEIFDWGLCVKFAQPMGENIKQKFWRVIKSLRVSRNIRACMYHWGWSWRNNWVINTVGLPFCRFWFGVWDVIWFFGKQRQRGCWFWNRRLRYLVPALGVAENLMQCLSPLVLILVTKKEWLFKALLIRSSIPGLLKFLICLASVQNRGKDTHLGFCGYV